MQRLTDSGQVLSLAIDECQVAGSTWAPAEYDRCHSSMPSALPAAVATRRLANFANHAWQCMPQIFSLKRICLGALSPGTMVEPMKLMFYRLMQLRAPGVGISAFPKPYIGHNVPCTRSGPPSGTSPHPLEQRPG